MIVYVLVPTLGVKDSLNAFLAGFNIRQDNYYIGVLLCWATPECDNRQNFVGQNVKVQWNVKLSCGDYKKKFDGFGC